MNLAIICGSQQPDSQSLKVAHFLKQRLEALSLSEQCSVIDLGEQPLALWDPSIWQGNPEWKAILTPIGETLKAADAFIVISPEYHGMVPAALKNFFLMWGGGELAHKPALLVAVSASVGGAYPIAELRMSSYKNNRISYMPEHLIVRNASKVLNEDIGGEDDKKLRSRIDYSLSLLSEYSKAYQGIRESGVIDLKTWRNGM
ncbi:NADPH-dependent FMN reductase [Pseudoteredinibacter isoporae]|uniref:NAD(P)H-dependent FMN reductase n=1 Tax=Pseudoteredinibacter isoporae TaxID=570281 RepID=A0A7X0JWV5_9GAMM|nr:NAD(P)H-dependent oxidoreductase [Pseudoteredinibacter isoporae]MBB6522756.1 NAD(P)H-dependent FMN reductase [Pseudoteredinibacter isoporae]NHO88285.1 NAD(P)H-dependent oxidoreductase [Pseudoteredinibacter isoporae]NIB23384.1 NAD(P)H-dependent oxidoreductase [Pseudoteredinibacter isoporae]